MTCCRYNPGQPCEPPSLRCHPGDMALVIYAEILGGLIDLRFVLGAIVRVRQLRPDVPPCWGEWQLEKAVVSPSGRVFSESLPDSWLMPLGLTADEKAHRNGQWVTKELLHV